MRKALTPLGGKAQAGEAAAGNEACDFDEAAAAAEAGAPDAEMTDEERAAIKIQTRARGASERARVEQLKAQGALPGQQRAAKVCARGSRYLPLHL